MLPDRNNIFPFVIIFYVNIIIHIFSDANDDYFKKLHNKWKSFGNEIILIISLFSCMYAALLKY